MEILTVLNLQQSLNLFKWPKNSEISSLLLQDELINFSRMQMQASITVNINKVLLYKLFHSVLDQIISR